MVHRELAVALWEEETSEYILGTSLCNPGCLHPAQANTSTGGCSVGTFVAER